MDAIMRALGSIPWSSLDTILLLVVSLLLILVSWRLYGATNRFIEAAENIARIEEAQEAAIKEQTSVTEQYVRELRDLTNLESLKFLDQLEFFYKNRPEEIKPRFGLDDPLEEERFLANLIESRARLSQKVFGDIVRLPVSKASKRKY